MLEARFSFVVLVIVLVILVIVGAGPPETSGALAPPAALEL
jgi:hypothetical protein